MFNHIAKSDKMKNPVPVPKLLVKKNEEKTEKQLRKATIKEFKAARKEAK